MIIFIFAAILTVATSQVIADKDLEHKKEIHNLKYHPEDVKKEEVLREALKKSRAYKI